MKNTNEKNTDLCIKSKELIELLLTHTQYMDVSVEILRKVNDHIDDEKIKELINLIIASLDKGIDTINEANICLYKAFNAMETENENMISFFDDIRKEISL